VGKIFIGLSALGAVPHTWHKYTNGTKG